MCLNTQVLISTCESCRDTFPNADTHNTQYTNVLLYCIAKYVFSLLTIQLQAAEKNLESGP